MIGGEGVETGLYVGEVVPEKNSHIDIKASAIRDGRIGMRARPRGLPILSPRRLHEPAHGEAVSDIPGDAWQLCCPIGDARGDTGGRIGHTSFPVPTRDRIVYGAPIFPEQLCIAHIELRAREAQLLARLGIPGQSRRTSWRAKGSPSRTSTGGRRWIRGFLRWRQPGPRRRAQGLFAPQSPILRQSSSLPRMRERHVHLRGKPEFCGTVLD
jgi:hypothetical protein